MKKINSEQLRRSVQQASAPTKEKRSEWKFSSGDKGGWRWRVTHPDGTEVSAHAGFATLKECIADATRHGYVVWIPEAERRKAES
ncbi:MAG: hypothetical protein ACXWCY_13990 [Burkholderiales bacterium]